MVLGGVLGWLGGVGRRPIDGQLEQLVELVGPTRPRQLEGGHAAVAGGGPGLFRNRLPRAHGGHQFGEGLDGIRGLGPPQRTALPLDAGGQPTGYGGRRQHPGFRRAAATACLEGPADVLEARGGLGREAQQAVLCALFGTQQAGRGRGQQEQLVPLELAQLHAGVPGHHQGSQVALLEGLLQLHGVEQGAPGLPLHGGEREQLPHPRRVVRSDGHRSTVQLRPPLLEGAGSLEGVLALLVLAQGSPHQGSDQQESDSRLGPPALYRPTAHSISESTPA